MLNSDDFITSSSIRYLVKHIKLNKADLIFLPIYAKGGLKSKINYNKSFLGMERVFFAHSASLMIKKETHLKYGFYTEKMPNFNGDVEFLYKLFRAKVSMVVAPYSQSSYGVYTYGGKSLEGPYYKKLYDEFCFRKKNILKDFNDFIYCILIVPLSFIYHFLKNILINFFKLF